MILWNSIKIPALIVIAGLGVLHQIALPLELSVIVVLLGIISLFLLGSLLYTLNENVRQLLKWSDIDHKNITSLQKNLDALYSNQKALSDSIKKLYVEIYRGKKKQKGIKEIPRGRSEESGPV